jgi:hypothetical protein
MTFRKVVVQFLLLITVGWAFTPASAQSKGKSHGEQQVITDVAGRVHKRTPHITHAQRKAVAERMKAARLAALKSQTKSTGVTK